MEFFRPISSWLVSFILATQLLLVNDASAGSLESIVVTARRVQEPSQDAAMSLVALSGDELLRRGFRDISRLDESAVNLHFDDSAPITGSTNAAEIFIRGVGQADFLLTTDPGVGVYLDGVYLSRSIGGVLSLLDVERVEILRGPQGTLYGRNTIGGAINVITKAPADAAAAELEVATGSFNRFDFGATLDLPLAGELLTSRLSVSSEERNGYLRRLQTGERTGAIDRQSGRFVFQARPSQQVEMRLSLDGSRARDESVAMATRWLDDPAQFGRGALTDLYNDVVAPSTGQPYDARWLPGDEFETNGTGPNRSEYDLWGTGLNVELDLGAVAMRSISSFRAVEARFGRDPDNSPLPIVHTDNRYEHEQFSQELQFSGGLFDQKVQWVAGLYYFAEDGTDDIEVTIVDGVFDAIGVPFSIAGPVDVDNRGAAVYSYFDYSLSSNWQLGTGLRYTREQKEVVVNQALSDVGQMLLEDPDASETFSDLSPNITLEYRGDDNQLIYGTVAKGFRSGGFTGRYVEPTPALASFDPEELISYELGYKSVWLEQRLSLNAAAFFGDYRDIQLLVFDGVAPQTRNAAEGETMGFEIEAVFRPFPTLRLTGGVGYIDAKYTKLDSQLDELFIPVTEDSQFVNTPKWSGNAAFDYERALGGQVVANLRVDYSYRSRVANDAINTKELVQESLHLVNARLAMTMNGGRWSVAVFGRNLGDERYVISGAADKPTFGTLGVVYGPPREWGVSLELKM